MEQAIQHVIAVSEHIAHVMKDREAQVVLHPGKCGWRESQFKIIKEQGGATKRETGQRVAGTGLIQSEAAVRVAAAHKQPLGQRNQSLIPTRRLPRLSNNGVPK